MGVGLRRRAPAQQDGTESATEAGGPGCVQGAVAPFFRPVAAILGACTSRAPDPRAQAAAAAAAAAVMSGGTEGQWPGMAGLAVGVVCATLLLAWAGAMGWTVCSVLAAYLAAELLWWCLCEVEKTRFQPVAAPVAMSPARRALLWRRCLTWSGDAREWLRGWFFDSEFEHISRADAKAWIAWAFWGTTPEQVPAQEQPQLLHMLQELEHQCSTPDQPYFTFPSKTRTKTAGGADAGLPMGSFTLQPMHTVPLPCFCRRPRVSCLLVCSRMDEPSTGTRMFALVYMCCVVRGCRNAGCVGGWELGLWAGGWMARWQYPESVVCLRKGGFSMHARTYASMRTCTGTHVCTRTDAHTHVHTCPGASTAGDLCCSTPAGGDSRVLDPVVQRFCNGPSHRGRRRPELFGASAATTRRLSRENQRKRRDGRRGADDACRHRGGWGGGGHRDVGGAWDRVRNLVILEPDQGVAARGSGGRSAHARHLLVPQPPAAPVREHAADSRGGPGGI